jgi:death-on-curing protein
LPSRSVSFLTLDEVLAIHEGALAQSGGREGVRDMGLLESALYRPQTGHYEDLVSMAAALFESLLWNHPFVDGNKRTAFFATDVFLRINGWYVRVDAHEAHRRIVVGLERGDLRFAAIRDWLAAAVARL